MHGLPAEVRWPRDTAAPSARQHETQFSFLQLSAASVYTSMPLLMADDWEPYLDASAGNQVTLTPWKQGTGDLLDNKHQNCVWCLCEDSRRACVWLLGEGGVWDLESRLQGSLKDPFEAASCLVGVVGWL